MSLQKELRVKIGYKLFGNSIARIFNKSQFDLIKAKIPNEFQNREICDLGCGDGYNTIKLKEMFRAKHIVGYDLNNNLIRRARKMGLDAYIMDLEKDMPKGEMATIFGVLHHIKNKEIVLRKIASNFDYVVIREPVKSWWAFLDGGEPLPKKEWISLFDKILGKYTFFEFKDNLIVFWSKNQG